MNKAAFLNIIRQVAPIQDQEVEDLEELVASFPYCQTAHILLAKAAYDRGSMLSTQKLRRAAAHASNRQLLKRIVYAPPILLNTVEQEILEEETPTVFGQIPGNEAKNGFPEVAPEADILDALENLSEEDLLESEVDSPIEIEEPEEELFEDQSIEEPFTENQEEAEIEEPFTGVEDSIAFEEEAAETETQAEEIQLDEEERGEILSPEVESATEESLSDSYIILEEKDSVFIEDLIQDEVQSAEENLEAAVLSQNEEEADLTLDIEDAFASVEESSLEETIVIAGEDNDESIPDDAENLLPEAGLDQITPEEENSNLDTAEPLPEAPTFDPEIEADFITNAVQKLNSVTTDFEGLNAVFFGEGQESSSHADSYIEEVTLNEDTEQGLNTLPNVTLTLDSHTEPVNQEFKSTEEVLDDSLEEDELFSLIQIDSLATLTAPIPSVNLTHAEIISELTSRSEPLDFTPEEEALQQEAVAAIVQEEPVVINAELVEFVAELEGRTVNAELEQSSFPMLQMAPTAAGTLEPEVEKDPYLNIFYHNSLAYWMDSSRMGETIQLRDDLTTSKPYYFQPDLILEHVRGNGAMEQVVKPVAKLDVQLSIIDQFLKSNPKLKSMAHLQQKSEPQEDLSAKSSKIKKNLASENLALIFIKQGKLKKALKIYEQLIVKFPEKKSYFAEQIEKLRNEL